MMSVPELWKIFALVATIFALGAEFGAGFAYYMIYCNPEG